jgi:signal transduction histidine kinase/CheY-like chemotaxis protein
LPETGSVFKTLMPPRARRWQSIDRKLPLLASSLVVLTAVVLGWSAYVMLERALVDATSRRLFSSATVVSQMVQLSRTRDSAIRVADRTLRAFAQGKLPRDSALAALAHGPSPQDTNRVYGALLDAAGAPAAVWLRSGKSAPAWGPRAVLEGRISGDTVSIGPIEDVGGRPVITFARVLRDTVRQAGAATPRVLGYVVEARVVAGRGARQIREFIGSGVQLLIGQPGGGVWSDLENVAQRPPAEPWRDTTLNADEYVAATSRIRGANWVVWLSQSKHTVLAPARAMIWTMLPLGLLIALLGAALTWRMAQHITRPIVQLTDAVELVAKDSRMITSGEHLAEGEPKSGNEVSRLRLAFDRMSARVAEREALEMQLRHAQKMEAVGQLAGGVAHDFNNLLTAIRSYADLMLDDMPEWDTKRGDVEEIRKAAFRASALTAQLLAFSRKQMLQPRVLDTAEVLQEVETMLRRLLIEDIRLSVDAPDGQIWAVRADRGQLEQVIVNLAVNARDAMPNGGALRITARNEVVERQMETLHDVVPPGEYVAIRVMDTGMGMDELTQSRAFEPFFTTKGVGKGTGLGLATVHGIVAQSGGYITLESRLNVGTKFTMYLPRAHARPSREISTGVIVARPETPTILLVEDEPAVRALARRVLVRAGYTVLESSSPSDALRLAREHCPTIGLVVTDVVMPEMSGPELTEKITAVCPGVRVLYMSGYAADDAIGRGLTDSDTLLLQKPFSAQQLVEHVRSALDGSSANDRGNTDSFVS